MIRIAFISSLLSLYTNCLGQYDLEKARNVIDTILDEYPGISVAVGRENDIIWSQGFGYSNVASQSAVNVDSKFRYYSLSKSITGIALIKLASQQKLDSKKAITEYMPYLPQSYNEVTVEQLISHTSGVRHYNKGEWMKISNNNCLTAKEALDVFIKDPLKFEPGTKSQYTSFGYVLLSALIEEVTGMPYYEYLRREIFDPLEISEIAGDQSPRASSNEVQYYDKWDRTKSRAKESKQVNNSCKFGGGGFVGTAQALVRLHLSMLNGRIVQGDYQEQYYSGFELKDGEPVAYAFGIGIAESNGVRYHSHTGSAVGAHGALVIYPEQKVVLVILGNMDNNKMNSILGTLGKCFLN